ncbi:reverse transcriptase domain-containing protein [Tanacetum coccineum]
MTTAEDPTRPMNVGRTTQPSRVKKQKKDDKDERLLSIFKQIHINLPFLEVMIHMPKGAIVLKDLLSHKEKLEKTASLVKLSEECSAIIQRSLPPKEGDLGSFTLPYLIGPLAVKNALANLGANDYLYCPDHTAKLVQEQWVDTVDHDGKWTEVEEEEGSNKVPAVSFYPKIEPVEPLEWKAPENKLKPSSIKPPKLELKELPEHLEYAFLQENNQLPVVISSALYTIEKARLLEVLKNHKGFKPSVQPQRRVNPNIKEVVKKEVIKLLDTGLIYPISGSPWVSPVQGCMTAIFHELIEDSMEVFMDDFSVFGIEVDKAKNRGSLKITIPHEHKSYPKLSRTCWFLQKVHKDFSQVARPMTQLLVKEAPFNFFEECTQAFDKLKCELTQAPIMIKPDCSLPFEVMCDASDYAVGAMLGKKIHKYFKPIHYASKTINEAQENYITIEKELLAVIFAFAKFRQYLVLSKTIVFTDHSALRYLFTKQDAKPRLIR